MATERQPLEIASLKPGQRVYDEWHGEGTVVSVARKSYRLQRDGWPLDGKYKGHLARHPMDINVSD